jgi:uncharacterized protein DUF4440
MDGVSQVCRQRIVRGGVLLIMALITSASMSSRGMQPDTAEWFRGIEQSLMDAIAAGDAAAWDRIMDDRCVVTSEEGEVRPKSAFLKELRPLPPGLQGGIRVRDLTVQEFSGFAVVRFLADEWETVFEQRLTTEYRVTDTFRRADSTWRMVSSHVSVVTTDPPAQKVATDTWPGLAGTYQLLPNGWKFHVVLRDQQLFGGRDPNALKRMIPLTSDAFVREGTLGEWIFVIGPDHQATHILNFRKFEPLVWTRVVDDPR